MNFKLALQLVNNMGLRYVVYRIRNEFEKKAGILKKKHPMNPQIQNPVSLEDWKRNTPRFVIPCFEEISFDKVFNKELKEKTKKILDGKICFFSEQWKDLGNEYDWITNPDSGYRYDISKHWSEIQDLSKEAGDIKYVWEKSRFSYFLTIIRNDYHFDEDHAEFIFSEIESYIP